MKIVRWMCALLMVGALAGCVKIDQTLTLEKDGSGFFEINYGMSEETVQQMENMQKMQAAMGEDDEEADDSNMFDFDTDKIKDEFSKMEQDGIKLVSVSSETKDGWKYMNIKISFDNLEALSKTDFLSDGTFSLTKNEDGNYVINQKSAGMGDDDEMTPEMKQMMLQQMAPAMKGMHIAMNVVVPSKIIDSNAMVVNGNKASWVFDVDKDPSFLVDSKMQDVHIEFAGKGINLPDITFGGDSDEME